MSGETGVTVVTMLVRFFSLRARLRAQWAPGIPCALKRPRDIVLQSSGALRVAGSRTHTQLSSSGSTGRSSIPEAPVMESIGRGVLDTRFRGYDHRSWSSEMHYSPFSRHTRA